MKKAKQFFLVPILILALVMGSFPMMAFADDPDEGGVDPTDPPPIEDIENDLLVVQSVSYTGANAAVSGKEITIKIESEKDVYLNTNELSVDLKSDYERVKISYSGESKSKTAEMTVRYKSADGSTKGEGTSTYNVTLVVEKPSVTPEPSTDPKFKSNISKSTSSTSAFNITKSDFTSQFIPGTDTSLTLAKVKLTKISSTSYGTLKYDGTECKTNQEYDLSKNFTFTAKSNTEGTVTYTFEGYDSKNNKVSNTIDVVVKVTTKTTTSKTASDINYTTSKNKAVDFSVDDFTKACKNSVGGTLNYIQFSSLPSSSYGKLYYNYKSSTEKYDHETKTSSKYYRNSSDKIDNLTFVPKSSYSGTVTLSYTGYNTDGTSFTGKVKVKVGTGSDSKTITYTANVNKNIDFQIKDFNSVCDNETGNTLNYVKFTLPSSSYGKLYLNYDSKSEAEVSASKSYYRNATPKIADITFVPKKDYSGSFTISYDAWDNEKEKYSGKIKITIGKDGDASVTYTVDQDSKFTFKTGDFTSQCKDETGGTLEYVKFSLPSSSNGTLYHDYGSKNESKVGTSDKYYRNNSKQNLIEEVTFVPNSSYSGSFTLEYTGYDTDNDSYKGKIKITVKSKSTQTVNPPTITPQTNNNGSKSDYFNDVGDSYKWAASSIDALHKKGVINGVGNGKFDPASPIKRGDFSVMLVKAFDFTADTSSNFYDVPSGSYYYNQIAILKALGISNGYSTGDFRPENPISREEAFVLISNALKVKGIEVSEGSSDDLAKYADGGRVSDFARPAAGTLVKAGYVKGDDDNRLNPLNNITRAEMSVLLYQIVQ